MIGVHRGVVGSWLIALAELAGLMLAGEPKDAREEAQGSEVREASLVRPGDELPGLYYGQPLPLGVVSSVRALWVDFVGVGMRALPLGTAVQHLVPEWQLHWRGHETVTFEEPRWIEHVVRPRERLAELAARHGARVEHVRLVNRLDRRRCIKPGQVLRIRARRLPPPRERHVHVVSSGERWSAIAGRWKVPLADLRGWNAGVELVEGAALEVWYDPATPWTVGLAGAGIPLDVQIAAGAESVGRPNRGRIAGAVALPESPLWTVRLRDAAFGSTHALQVVADSIARMRASTGWNGELVISSISREGGGRLRPHRSHQSGRDFDIRLPVLPGRGLGEGVLPDPDDVDWDATWALVEVLAYSGQVDYVFLERRLQPRLADAARAAGTSQDRISGLIQSERGSGDPLPLVKHEAGHVHHVHVRIACGPEERRCRD